MANRPFQPESDDEKSKIGLRKVMPDKKRYSCFFVTPIGERDSALRGRADAILQHVLRPTTKSFLDIVRADEVDEPGTITTDIVRRLYEADLVIADLTGHNPNVMYEIGLRHCFNKPIVHLAQDKEKPPFDLAAERIIFFDLHDISSVEEGKRRILSSCKSALDARPFRSPVARALELESLFAQTSELPVPRDLLKKLDDLEASISGISENVGDWASEIYAASSYVPAEADALLISRVEELIRLFNLVGPGDIARLAEKLRER